MKKLLISVLLFVLFFFASCGTMFFVINQTIGSAEADAPGVGGSLKNGTDVPAALRPWIEKAGALCKGITPALLAAQLKQESGFAPDVISGARVSSAGAQGVAQFMPGTWKGYANDANGNGEASPLDPPDAIMAQGKYMCELYGQAQRSGYGGNPVVLALAGYNAGWGAVQRYKGVPPYKETQGYVTRITQMASQYVDKGSLGADSACNTRGNFSLERADLKMIRPAKGTLTSPFGPRFHPILHYWRLHDGQDIGAPTGTDILAAESGKVVRAGFHKGNGNFVTIDHGRVNGERIETMYLHMNRPATVCLGAVVSQGQLIGEVGSTGLSTGPHLHFKVIVNGTPVNPTGWIPAR